MRTVSLLLAAAFLASPASPPVAPAALRPPAAQTLLLSLRGKGAQIYVCTGVWKLKAPDAKLFTNTGELVGQHFAGPTWESRDGSSVTGKLVASVPSPDSNSIPWLLLTATAHSGSGVFEHVQSIQRLETKGGLAPSTGCSEGAEVSVEYEATYYFYGSQQMAAP